MANPSTALATIDPRQQSLKALFESAKGSISKVVPAKYLTADRLLKVALNAISRNPRLLDCEPQSILNCLMQAAELGLEVCGGLQHCYMVPYRNSKRNVHEAQFQIGYRGMVELAHRSGTIDFIEAVAVREGDKLRYERGLNPVLEHVPSQEGDAAKLVAAYTIVRIKGCERPQFDLMWRWEIDAVRKRSKASDDGPWVTDYDEMAKKTSVKRTCKMVSLSPEMADAIEADDKGYNLDVSAAAMASVPEAAPQPAAKPEEKPAEKRGRKPAEKPAEQAPAVDRPITVTHTVQGGQVSSRPIEPAPITSAAVQAEPDLAPATVQTPEQWASTTDDKTQPPPVEAPAAAPPAATEQPILANPKTEEEFAAAFRAAKSKRDLNGLVMKMRESGITDTDTLARLMVVYNEATLALSPAKPATSAAAATAAVSAQQGFFGGSGGAK